MVISAKLASARYIAVFLFFCLSFVLVYFLIYIFLIYLFIYILFIRLFDCLLTSP